MLRHPFKIIGLLLAVILVMGTCSGSGDLFVEESAFNIFKTSSYYPDTSSERGENISVSIINLKPVPATYAFDTSFVSPPSWLKIDANTGTISGAVPANAPVGTTKYTIKITGTGQYSGSPEQRLEFVLALKIADLPNPLRLNVQGMILKKHGNAVERSGNSMVIDANNSKLTVRYSYSANNATAQPSWLSLNQNTGAIAVNNANQGDLPAIGDAKTYKIKITGTGIYEGKTSDIDFIITGTALEIPADISYDSTTIEKGSNVTVNLSNATGGFTATYAFDASFAPPPSWLRIDANTGTISGTVPVNASISTIAYTINIRGTGAYQGETTSRLFITLTGAPAALPTTLAYDSKTVARSSYMSQTVKGGGGASSSAFALSYAFAATPAKPAWLSIDANTGAISGTVPLAESASETTYKIIVNGGSGSIYAGATQREIDFTLTVSSLDACSVALSVACSEFAQAYTKASNTDEYDRFGISVALSSDGNTLAVGAQGEDSNARGVNGGQTNNNSVNSGAVYVFTRSTTTTTTTWSQQAYIKASNAGASDYFGTSVALSSDGNTLAVGAIHEDSNARGVGGDESNNSANNSGAVYVFTRSSSTTTWSQQAYIKASDTGANDWFGYSVALSSDGNTLAVGEYGEDSNARGVGGDETNNSANSSGAVYVFTRSTTTTTTTWSQQAYIKASNTGAHDWFGFPVALSSDGNTLAVGARTEDSNARGVGGDQSNNSASNSGAVYVFTRSTTTTTTTWSQQAYIKASNTGTNDRFGYSVALSSDGNTLAVGAYFEDSNARGVGGDQSNNSAGNSGAVYVFTRSSTTTTTWSQQAYIKASNTGAGDHFGNSVALSSDGNTLAVSARDEDSNARGVGGDQSNNSADGSGAVYVFTRSSTTTTTTWSQQAYTKASNTGAHDYFGYSIALSSDGNTLAVGAYNEDSDARGVGGNQSDNSSRDSGAVYIRRIAP